MQRIRPDHKLENTNVMAQGAETPPNIVIDGCPLEVVENFTYLGSTISSLLTIDSEINNRIARAATVMAQLKQRVWSNPNLTERTRLRVYHDCVLSTLLYGSETWTTYARQEKKLNSFHMRCLQRILQIKWQDRVPDMEVLEQANTCSLSALLAER